MIVVAGDDPFQALQHFAQPTRRALHCITQVPANAHGYEPGKIHVMTFPGHDIVPLARNDNQPRLMFLARQHYRVIETPDTQHGPWRVNIVGYMYTLQDRDGREIVSYHWHPDQRSPVTYPHLHIGIAAVGEGASVSRRAVPGIHFPTRFIPLQDIIRLAITQFNVRPLRNDWEQVLRETDVEIV